jgi:putative membrane protein
MEKLHPGAKWIFRLSVFVFVVFFLIWGVVAFIISSNLAGFALLGISLIFLIIGEFFVQWNYQNWKYEFTKETLKIEKGVIIKTYKSIPYERIQNVDITRGILARIIGFSTVDIQTAGYSYHGELSSSEGHLPAVSIEHGEEIRNFLVKKISHHNKQGL